MLNEGCHKFLAADSADSADPPPTAPLPRPVLAGSQNGLRRDPSQSTVLLAARCWPKVLVCGRVYLDALHKLSMHSAVAFNTLSVPLINMSRMTTELDRTGALCDANINIYTI